MAHEEQVAIVDGLGRRTGSAPRSVMRRDNLRHLVVAVLVRDPTDRVYVHRRAPDKDLFAGMHDAWAAGCVTAGERPEEAARRELAEELGVHGVRLRLLGTQWYEDGATRHLTHAYTTTYDGPITHQPEEIVWGAWMDVGELATRLADPGWPFVPDGRAMLGTWLAGLAWSARPDR